MALIPVTFNEGEPLDVNKLNDLKLNITNTYQATNVLQNATQDGKYVPLIDFDFLSMGSIKANEIKAVKLPISSVFKGTPKFIVSLASAPPTGAQVTLFVRSRGANPEVCVLSTKAISELWISWIALEKKTV